DDTIGVTAQDVARKHTGVADVDRAVDRLELHTVLPRPHRVAAAEHGITDLSGEMGVAAGAVDHSTGNLSAVRHHRENVSPDCGVFAAAVIDDDHASFRYFVDEVTDRSRRNTSGTVQQGVRASG